MVNITTSMQKVSDKIDKVDIKWALKGVVSPTDSNITKLNSTFEIVA